MLNFEAGNIDMRQQFSNDLLRQKYSFDFKILSPDIICLINISKYKYLIKYS
jgi:hypothetical protein